MVWRKKIESSLKEKFGSVDISVLNSSSKGSHAPVGAWLRKKTWPTVSGDVPHGTSQVMKFYYIYVLKSLIKDFIYVGFTTDLKTRFKRHNSGSEFSTKPYIPFELIHYEAYRNEKDAKRREEYFKTTKGKTTLKTMLKEYLHHWN